MGQTFILYGINGKCLGKRAVGVPDELRAGRSPIRSHWVIIGERHVCYDCGHRHWLHKECVRFEYPIIKHEFDHFKGYDCINKIFVQEVCRPCHVRRTAMRRQRHKAGLPKYG